MNLQEIKNQIVGITYEEKIQLSDWLHKQIQIEMADATKKKAAETSERFGNFLTKAANVTKTGGSDLFKTFGEIFNNQKEQSPSANEQKKLDSGSESVSIKR